MNELDMLWDLLKNHPHEQGIKCTGLRKVEFTLNIEEFTEKYKIYLSSSEEGPTNISIENEIADVIKILQSSSILYHHRSCVASKRTQNNSAICVHYYDKNNINSALAIAGVNYISEIVDSLTV
jgi:hypothetical protein